MNVEENIPKSLQDALNETLGDRYRVTFARLVQIEAKSDKVDTRILVLTAFRLLLISNKSPRKVEHNFLFTDISTIESKNVNKLVISAGGKRISLTALKDNGKECNLIISHIFLAFSRMFPEVGLEKFVNTIEVCPNSRLTEICNATTSLLSDVPRPCGNYSETYRYWCEYHGSEPMEDVVWDVDHIYSAQDNREFCLNDFDHVESRHMMLILLALQHNTWFTHLSFSETKMSPENLSNIRKILKSNRTIRKLSLVNSGIRPETVGKLVKSLSANESLALNSLNLSGNLIEDRGVKNICSIMNSLPHGLVELQLSAAALTTRGINNLATALMQSKKSCHSLRVLDLSENNTKGEDISSLLSFLTSENVLQTIRLTSMECYLETLISAMNPGCCRKLEVLDVSGNFYSRKPGKDVVCPQPWKQFFSSAAALKSVNFSSCRLPPDAIKTVLLGIACNQLVKGMELNLSGNDIGESGAEEIFEMSLPSVTNVASLDISDNGFDAVLASVLGAAAQNKGLKKLSIGRNVIKAKNVPVVMESIIRLIQEDNCSIESLSLDNMRLKTDATIVLNALGTNSALRELDISGNQMGDSGAKMLAKALLLNRRLRTVYLDNNNITLSGFQQIAAALEKNHTLQKMPTPLNDAASALHINPDKTEAVFKKISAALDRNLKPRKLAMEQTFRLQHGLRATFSEEMVGNGLTKLQDFTRRGGLAQGQTDSDASHPGDTPPVMSKAGALSKDLVAARHLLLELQKLVIHSDMESLVRDKLVQVTQELQDAVQKQTESNIDKMIGCAQKLCPTVLSDKNFSEKLHQSLPQTNRLPSDFISKLITDQVSPDLYNTLNDQNVKLSLSLLDSVIDQLIREVKTITTSGISNGVVNNSPTNIKDQNKESPELRRTNHSVSDASEEEKLQETVGEKRRSRLYLRPQSSFADRTPSSSNNDSATTTADELTLTTTKMPLQHLGKDRPKRQKTKASKHVILRERIEEADELKQGCDDFFSTNFSSA